VVLTAILCVIAAYDAASVDGISDYEQEQEMELEALQSILMDDIKGYSLLSFPNSSLLCFCLARPCSSSLI
jgi:hypothetical protein